MEALIDTAMEQRRDSAGGSLPAQITSRSPRTQACTSRAQDSHDLEGTGAVKREDGTVLKYEAACNIRTPQVDAHGESKLAIPESNVQSLTGNAKTAERGKLSVRPTLKGSGYTTPLAAERKALPLCSTLSPVRPDGPIALYWSGKGQARNVDQQNSNMSAHAGVSLPKREADAMQKTCQLHRENTAASRSCRHIRGLNEPLDMQDLPFYPTCSPYQEAMLGELYTTQGLHRYSNQWCDRKYQSVVREDHSAVGNYQGHTQSRNSHYCEEVESNAIEVQPAESSNTRRKIEHTQALDNDKLSDYANFPHIPFVENARLPADIERRGYPRLIHIEHFSRETNTDNLTMADFVATILFHHSPQTLTAFFDEKRYPKFGFATRSPSRAQDFAIERKRKEHGLVVKCGYGAGYLIEKYVYLIEADGRWVPKSFKEYLASTIMEEALIEQMAEKTGKDLLCDKVWIRSYGSIIRIDDPLYFAREEWPWKRYLNLEQSSNDDIAVVDSRGRKVKKGLRSTSECGAGGKIQFSSHT